MSVMSTGAAMRELAQTDQGGDASWLRKLPWLRLGKKQPAIVVTTLEGAGEQLKQVGCRGQDGGSQPCGCMAVNPVRRGACRTNLPSCCGWTPAPSA